MRDEEAAILWQATRRWSSKFQVMLGFALFRGMRIGEICAINLYDFQNDIVRWAIKRGRAAIFADCGLGKTFMQLEWAKSFTGTVLIVAPLSVNDQSVQEAETLGIAVNQTRKSDELKPGINITNYEMLSHFIGAELDAIVLDESSILKSLDGKTRKLLLDEFTYIPYRLCCTATPAPNDIAEIANHAHFLGIKTRQEMLACFFVHDQKGWRLRGHAHDSFYKWMASWSMTLRSPEDLGYDGSRFALPELRIHDLTIATDWRRPGQLFPGDLKGISDRAKVRKASAADRVKASARLIERIDGQIIVWCGLNDESQLISRSLGRDAIEVSGSMSTEEKLKRIQGFLSGKFRVLVTKPKIAGFGMNFQNAHTMVFLGLGDSYETYYQCIRRSYRYGQTKPVDVYVVVTDHEIEIVGNVRRKERQAKTLQDETIKHIRRYEMEELESKDEKESYEVRRFKGENWEIVQGDCVEELKNLNPDSVDMSVYSPPFIALYTYSDSDRDMGNSTSPEQFFKHFKFAVQELLKVTKPGRLTCVHVAQVATTLVSNGVIGIKDFRGQVCELFTGSGWIYHGEICIDKDPQAQAIRTHAKGLLFVQLKKDGSWLRPALADYILVFRKPGENAIPIKPEISNDQWISWARPIWYGIRETETLNVKPAKDDKDDRHVCPLQLGVIERCIKLWSNPGDLILSPFAGIGSEGYVAIKEKRRFIGIELKPLYADTAVKNLKKAERETVTQVGLFQGSGDAS
ncbi:MAG: helicase [Proteobacteria bacterium]|nr:helicase [Pseudomonadota bacterium]